MIAVIFLAAAFGALSAIATRRVLAHLKVRRAKKRLKREIIRVQIAIGRQLEEPLRRCAELLAKTARQSRNL